MSNCPSKLCPRYPVRVLGAINHHVCAYSCTYSQAPFTWCKYCTSLAWCFSYIALFFVSFFRRMHSIVLVIKTSSESVFMFPTNKEDDDGQVRRPLKEGSKGDLHTKQGAFCRCRTVVGVWCLLQPAPTSKRRAYGLCHAYNSAYIPRAAVGNSCTWSPVCTLYTGL